MERDALVRAWTALLVALAAEVAVLVITGVALFFLYRPSAAQAWSDLAGEAYGWDVRTAFALRAVHRLASGLAVPTAVAAGVVVALRGSEGRRWAAPALGAGFALVTLGASFTGYLLPWDQLALRAVTVGSTLRGYTPLFDPVVRFVLIGGAEVSAGTVLWWLFVHAVVLGPLLGGLLVLTWRRSAQAGRVRSPRRLEA